MRARASLDLVRPKSRASPGWEPLVPSEPEQEWVGQQVGWQPVQHPAASSVLTPRAGNGAQQEPARPNGHGRKVGWWPWGRCRGAQSLAPQNREDTDEPACIYPGLTKVPPYARATPAMGTAVGGWERG